MFCLMNIVSKATFPAILSFRLVRNLSFGFQNDSRRAPLAGMTNYETLLMTLLVYICRYFKFLIFSVTRSLSSLSLLKWTFDS